MFSNVRTRNPCSPSPKVLSPKYVRRHNTYVAIIRTLPKYVRRRITYVDKICTSPEYVRQEGTYVTGTRTSPVSISKCVSEYSISQRCSWTVLFRNVSSLRCQTELETFTNAAYYSSFAKRPSFRSENAQIIVGHRNILK